MGIFPELCKNTGLKECRSLPWNPQSNAILERIHQVLQDCLVTLKLDNKEIPKDKDDPFEEYLASVAYAIRASFHASKGHSPAKLVFGRDMFIPISRNINWDTIK